jgi:hypothetical protein
VIRCLRTSGSCDACGVRPPVVPDELRVLDRRVPRQSRAMKKKPDLFKVGLAYILGCQIKPTNGSCLHARRHVCPLLLLTARVSTLLA